MNSETRKQNNLTIAHIIVGLGDGGAEATLYKLITGDKKNNHIVISLTDFGKYGKLLKNNNIPVIKFNFKKNRLNLSGIYKIIKTIKLYKPNIIQSWMYHADLISCMVKIFNPRLKIIWGIRNTTYKLKESYSRYFISRICSIFSHFVPNIIISCGYEAMNQHKMLGYAKKKIKVICNGVDLKTFNTKDNLEILLELEKNYKINVKKIAIGMVARYDKQKGFDILIEALTKLKRKKIEFNCFLIGTNVDNNNEKLVSLIKKNNLSSSIFLLGQRNNIENIFNLLDITILSSINGEGFPNVLIESMACGTPCVATDIGDSKYIIDDTGWIACPNDFDSLADSIEKAIFEFYKKNLNLKKLNCKKRVIENFDINLMIKKFQDTWSKI